MDSRIAFELGPLRIHWYGIIVTAGMIVGTYVAAREMKRRGENPGVVWDGVLWVIVLGIVGARLYHVFSSPNDGSNSGWDYYRQQPLQILAIWNGGLGIYGGLIGGIVGAILVSLKYRVSFWRLADSAAPGVLLAQSIGRWGNYFNQELYGGPTGSSWWGITIDPAFRIRTPHADFTDLQRYPPETRFHPTFFYESAWNFVGFLGLMWIARRFRDRLCDGDIMGMYFIWYGLGRSWIELFFRPDAWTFGPLPTAVLISVAAIIFGVGVLLFNHGIRRPPSSAPRAAVSA
ncbi:MAG: prolipoprotein diacylglyceryl transferase [Thermoflexales bacterium]|nr:prolipoprotein diacylglyceryl transferase [Thermoflexales bacterium]MDW8350278.1 prolipoprotein diacylglyceryl transferase [Anaerolineae bacterium]